MTLGKQVMEAFLELLPERKLRLLLDGGSIDGKWLGELKRDKVDVVIGVKSDMHL